MKFDLKPKKGKIWCNACQRYHKIGNGHEFQTKSSKDKIELPVNAFTLNFKLLNKDD